MRQPRKMATALIFGTLTLLFNRLLLGRAGH